MRAAKVDGRTVEGRPMRRDQHARDTLSPARRLMTLVNRDETFVTAQELLGMYPQKLYTMIQEVGEERVRRVTDFVISIVKDNPGFFRMDPGTRTPRQFQEQLKAGARATLITIALEPDLPILEKHAESWYWERWGGEE